jgi:hypothetical protein
MFLALNFIKFKAGQYCRDEADKNREDCHIMDEDVVWIHVMSRLVHCMGGRGR